MVFESLTVFAYNADDQIREIAKKNSETDITIYSRKNGDLITTFISPTRYPDKISALTDSLYPCDAALVRVDSINRDLGEVLLGISLMKIPEVLVMVEQSVDRSFLERILKEARLQSYEFTDLTGLQLAEKLEGMKRRDSGGSTRIVVDQFFKVKSVGTVILGFVLSGTAKKHQELTASYSGRKLQIRSIQMQDIDVDEAPAGSRVGLAVKNIDIEELDRGVILSDEDIQYFTESEGEFSVHPSIKTEFPQSFEVFVSDCMRYQRGTYSGGKLKMDRKVAGVKNEYVLASPNSTPRIIGVFRPSDQ